MPALNFPDQPALRRYPPSSLFRRCRIVRCHLCRGKGEDSQCLFSPAQLQLMKRHRIDGKATTPRHQFGNHQLRTEFLGRSFQAAGRIDSVADGGQMLVGAIAHVANDDRAEMNADTDTQGLLEIGTQMPVEFFEIDRHAARGFQRLGAGTLAIVAMLAIAFVKGRLVILDFMELREAPKLWRILLEGWLILVSSLILLAYWISLK